MMSSAFQRNYYLQEALLSWKWLNDCLLLRSSEWNSCFALLAYTALLYLLYFLSHPTMFLTFIFPILPSIPGRRGVSARLCYAWLCEYWELSHNNLMLRTFIFKMWNDSVENWYSIAWLNISGKLINCQWEEAEYLHTKLTSVREK